MIGRWAAAARIGPKAVFVRLDVTSESNWTDLTKYVMGAIQENKHPCKQCGNFFSGSTIVENKRRSFSGECSASINWVCCWV